jgi:hypothetical protein
MRLLFTPLQANPRFCDGDHIAIVTMSLACGPYSRDGGSCGKWHHTAGHWRSPCWRNRGFNCFHPDSQTQRRRSIPGTGRFHGRARPGHRSGFARISFEAHESSSITACECATGSQAARSARTDHARDAASESDGKGATRPAVEPLNSGASGSLRSCRDGRRWAYFPWTLHPDLPDLSSFHQPGM